MSLEPRWAVLGCILAVVLVNMSCLSFSQMLCPLVLWHISVQRFVKMAATKGLNKSVLMSCVWWSVQTVVWCFRLLIVELIAETWVHHQSFQPSEDRQPPRTTIGIVKYTLILLSYLIYYTLDRIWEDIVSRESSSWYNPYIQVVHIHLVVFDGKPVNGVGASKIGTSTTDLHCNSTGTP
jgi:hypothetical protein